MYRGAKRQPAVSDVAASLSDIAHTLVKLPLTVDYWTMRFLTKTSILILVAATFLYSTGSLAQPKYGAVGDLYAEVCSSCHGDALQGTGLGNPLVGVELNNGNSVEEIVRSIRQGSLEPAMPAMESVLEPEQIQALAIFVLEQRAGFNYDSYNMRESITIPQSVQRSVEHDFVLSTVIENLDPLPWSLVPMPDGRTLLVEKKRGLSVISATGEQSELIVDTPRVWNDSSLPEGLRALDRGKGWMQDVVLHPNYESNGWIYIYYGDRCDDCNVVSREQGKPVGMAKVVRGRIENGAWIDQQTVWQTGYENYTTNTDLALGGRAAFDDDGYLYFSIGAMNGFYDADIQNLARPWGKIHRVHDDGRIPMDNPFVATAGAVQSIWTFGHRAPQGLEFDAETGILWGSEHGPRGGDEINKLLPGRNYGWPLTSRGVDYDGTSVEGRVDIAFDIDDIEQPVVDLTPSPAISSFVVYRGDPFPGWEGNLIVGSLKAHTLYRFVIEDGVLIRKETLIEGIGRIRDIEVANDGNLLLLIENVSGAKVLRLSPAKAR